MQHLLTKLIGYKFSGGREDINFSTNIEDEFKSSLYTDNGTTQISVRALEHYLCGIAYNILFGSFKPNMYLDATFTKYFQTVDGGYLNQESNLEYGVDLNACDINIISKLDTQDTSFESLPKIVSFSIKDAPITDSTDTNESLILYVRREYSKIFATYWYGYDKPIVDPVDPTKPFVFGFCKPSSINIVLKKNSTAPKPITTYDEESHYVVGDQCYYNYHFYTCKTDTENPAGEFDSTYWNQQV